MEPRRRKVLSGALFALVVLLPLGTMLLWWLGTLPDHYHPEIGRTVFGNIPEPLVALFYVGAGVFLGLTAYLFAIRARNWERGAPERRSGQWGERFKALVKALSLKSVLEDRAAGLMHALIYWGFVLLLFGTIIVEIDHLLPGNLKFVEGAFYQGFSLVLDVAALMLIGGLIWAAVRRYLTPPLRIATKTRPEDAVILVVLGLVATSGLIVEAVRIAAAGRPAFEVWSFAGYGLSYLVPDSAVAGVHQVSWVFHAVTFCAFLIVLPVTKLRHALTSPVNMVLSARERPVGAMRPIPNLMEATDIESIGAAAMADFTWKQLLDTDACTICGRCTSVCPANQTGKPLDPREIVLKLGTVAALTGDPVVSPPVGVDREITVTADSVFERITAAELWACTTCRACDDICPVDIEILDKILDMRRYLALMEGDFPSELGATFISMENSSNPYGMSQKERAAWTDEVDFEVKVVGEPGVTAEYLYWVGCAGSFDDRNKKVTIATARLLDEAGVDFAILGSAELCTGDPARRAGNEYVFQQLALQNIETLNDLGITKVITQCPHCFNTLANEYPQFGGEYEVIHHSQMLMQLIDEERIVPRTGSGRITYHDPCYLGRHNDVFVAPRQVLQSITDEYVDMPRCGTDAFCCGAGGSRMWMEEQTGKKINIERTEEAVATGADQIATGCPFCYVMIDDGVKEIGREDIVVQDLSMLLAERSLDD
ncbi:respiratory nitrate reductase subunit gamma [bacterium]|nr:respiratory nitrate reductase subunit gamma [bacterium]